MHRPALHRFAWFTASCTILLIAAGGLVTSTGSGLAVPDWPLSYGSLMPPMVGGIFYEHGHRMIASFVGFLTVVLAFWVWRVESRRWVRRLSLAALGAVVCQGLLGGLTVIYLLPTPISVLHACLAQTFFCMTVVLALALGRDGPALTVRQTEMLGGVRTPALILVGVVYVQLVLGALVRHTESGLAIPDFPLSFGHLFPPLSELTTNPNAAYPISLTDLKARVMTHYIHRVWALAVAGVVLWFAWRVIRHAPELGSLVQLATTLVVLTIAQVLLGASVVWSQKSVGITTAHVVVGAAILGTCVMVLARIRGWASVTESRGTTMVGEPAREV